MRPAIRLAAVMGLHVSTCSPTTASRSARMAPCISRSNRWQACAIPNLIVIRPGDANETAVAWQVAVEMIARWRCVDATMCPRRSQSLRRLMACVMARRFERCARGRADVDTDRQWFRSRLDRRRGGTLARRGIAVRCVSMPAELSTRSRRNIVTTCCRCWCVRALQWKWAWRAGSGVGDRAMRLCRTLRASAPAETLLREYGQRRQC